MTKRIDTEECINKCKEKHGGSYDYSLTEYKNQKTPIRIICKEHGVFEQLPTNHYWKGQGCPKCAQRKRNTFRTTPYEKFLQQALQVHGRRYSYDESSYINKNAPLKIICKEHGEFFQTPASHTNQKQGCPKCAGKNKTQDEVIREFENVHKHTYVYDKVVYVNAHKKVEIVCVDHGSFFQTPAMHKSGQGCPLCGYRNHHGKYTESYFKGKGKTEGSVYVWELHNEDEVFIKIGITRTSVKKRINNNKTRKYKTNVLFEHKTTLQEAYRIEQLILHRYKDYQYAPVEKFQGRTECLLITQKQSIIYDIIQELTHD